MSNESPTETGAWGWLVAEDDFAALAGADWPVTIMTRPVTDRFHAKQNRNIGRLSLESAGQVLVVYLKRHFERRSWWQRRLDVLFGVRSPARVEYDCLEWVHSQKLPAPRVVAAGERRAERGRESFLTLEELTGMLALHELIPLAFARLSPTAFQHWKRGLGREVARLAAAFHSRGAFHQDLYLCHFYARTADIDAPPETWRGRVAVIDFHRLTHRRRSAVWLRVKDLAQLLFSADGVAGLTRPDVLRVFAWYRRETGCGRWLAAAARWKAARYLAHNRRRL